MVDGGAWDPGVVAALVGGVCGGISGAIVAAVLAFVQSLVNRRWERRDARAGEIGARLEERFKGVRAYATELDRFVHSASAVVAQWVYTAREDGVVGDQQAVQEQLKELWAKVEQLKPEALPWSAIDDVAAEVHLSTLVSTAERCRDVCMQCVQTRVAKGWEDFPTVADENLKDLKAAMDEMVREAGR